MDFSFTKEQEALRDRARQFAEAELAPQALALDEKGEFPREAARQAAQMGLVGSLNSREFGGSALGHLARMLAIEEISRVYAPLGFFFDIGLVGLYILERAGTEEQKRRHLPPLCRGESISCFALTEAGGGSEPTGMQTTARPEGDGYVVNGRKSFITLGEVADLVVLVAMTGQSYNAFLVERGTPGFQVARREARLGFRSIPVNELAFTDCLIPKANLLGQEGRGLALALDGVATVGRTGVAGVGLGVARGCFEAARKFAKERVLYGKPIAQLQGIQFQLVDMDVDIEAARWLAYYVAWLLDQGKTSREVNGEIARAKLYACEVATRVALMAVRLMGGYGLSPENQVARHLRDALELAPVSGTQEVMKVVIASGILR